MYSLTCPDRQELIGYFLGKLPEEALDRIVAHVDACAECRSTLDSLSEVPDSLLPQLKHLTPKSVNDEDPALPQLLAQAKTIGVGKASAAHDPFVTGEASTAECRDL